ncbi:gliding motility protein GldL [uncultured Algibacter sp.]|uniref:gliding motility protein GldL n=1 Tax=uncultured Algibacter sp. TaxID=298659 RepID=UPI00321661A1
MKFKNFVIPLIIFLVGLILTYIGALFKIIHFQASFITGNLLISIATGLKVLAVILAIVKLIFIYRK